MKIYIYICVFVYYILYTIYYIAYIILYIGIYAASRPGGRAVRADGRADAKRAKVLTGCRGQMQTGNRNNALL